MVEKDSNPDPRGAERRPSATKVLAYLQSMFDDMFEGMQVLDFDYRYIYLNQTAARHGKRAREELIGRRMVDMYPGIQDTEVYRLIERCMTDRVPQQMTNRFTYPDGHVGWFDLRISPIAMGVLILSVDISARIDAEEELGRSREDLAATLECMAESVITTGVDGRVVRMNPAAERLTGWSQDEARGRHLDRMVTLLNQQNLSPVPHPVDTVLRDGLKLGLANHTVLVTRDGTRTPIASSGVPIRNPDGSIRGVVLVLKDMKEEYELADMLRHSQKMESVGRLAAGVAHDFNNLLSVICGYGSLALSHTDGSEQLKRYLTEMCAAGERAATLTRQLLTFSRRAAVKPRTLDVNSILESMDKMLRRLLGEDISLITSLSPDPYHVLCDPGQLEQVVMNLAVNARDAMPDGGTLTLESSNITLPGDAFGFFRDVPAGEYLLITAADTGTGMEAEVLEKIFDPFFTTKPAGSGTGLGLSTVYGIVRQNGGAVAVSSLPGQGSTFRIALPRTTELLQPDSPEPEQKATHPAGGTVLVVEDDESVRTLVLDILELNGMEALGAETGTRGLELHETHEGIDLLLTDLALPDISGVEVAERTTARDPDLKVIYMSGYADRPEIARILSDPGIEFLEKPFRPSDLMARIHGLLGAPRRKPAQG